MPSRQFFENVRWHLTTGNRERAHIAKRAAIDIGRSFARWGYPIDPAEIRAGLSNTIGIERGDIVLVHSSVSNLYRAAPKPPSVPILGPVDYANRVLDILLDLVGPDGTLLMPTDSIKNYTAFSHRRQVFDYETMPSRRGLVTELFRKRPGVMRSVHPYYNLSAIGPRAKELLEDHHRSQPYTMDEYSPWYKLTMMGGKVLFLGVDYEINSLIHLVEYLHPREFPRPLFYDKPYPVLSRGWDGKVAPIDVMLHAVELPIPTLPRFCTDYLNKRYSIYTTVPLGKSQVIGFRARDQYDATLKEMRNDVVWYDVPYWEAGRS